MAEFRAVALIAARNEADIISQVLEHLITNDLQVYLIDDDSTDETVAEATRWLGRGLLQIERRPPAPVFDWTGILAQKETLASELDADWFLHHDADEFREGPWPERTLLESIQTVDALGYNAIDFRVLNFPPTHDRFARGMDIREAFTHFDPAPSWDAFQVKAWKRTSVKVDLVSSAGHDAMFAGRRVCPIQFLSRHYPIRGQAHGQRKVLTDRVPRFSPAEVERRWHVHYQQFGPDTIFIRDPRTLRQYNQNEIRDDLLTNGRDAFLRAIDAERAENDRRELEVRRTAAEAARDALEKDCRSAQTELEHARAALCAADVELGKRRDEIAALRTRLEAERVDAAAGAEDAARKLMATIADAAARQQAAEQRLEQLRVDLQRVSTDLEQMHQSASWRLTRPLRRAYEMLSSSATRNPADRGRP